MITETTTRRDALVKELRTYLAPVTKGDAPADTLRSLAGAALDDIAKGIRTREPALTPERAFVKAMDQAPELVKAYNDGQDRGEPAEFAPAPVAKREARCRRRGASSRRWRRPKSRRAQPRPSSRRASW